MTTEWNKALASRIIEEVWNRGDHAALEILLAPGYIGHDPAYPVGNRAEFGTFVRRFRATFPDIRFSIEAQIAEGDWVMTRWRARGSHQGELGGLPATGKAVAITGITLSRIVAGQVIEDWRNWDTLGLIEQLGTDPSTFQGTTKHP